MKHLRWILVLLVLLLVVIIVVQNYEALATKVSFRANFMFWEGETLGIPLSLVAIITFLIGIVFSGSYGMAERFRLKKQIRSLIKEAREKDKELSSLRNLPVTTENIDSDQTTDTR
ncbi:MAG: LapA family protein [Deltaproteobacteria bacterium]|nr:LapA family protein [Deltaproteobacteria bacterium]MBW1738160.1 LapA family protein [Deltaproteobacteria bacterium]MBW1908575.1 LapA family protein [Deltaproteobacteria bacterium]MBW2032303.1 LapA family protein [Deltaproteobacteria bacterium]MBW2113668.1 LapA family protein [Deltaproteobacteria bacterium]